MKISMIYYSIFKKKLTEGQLSFIFSATNIVYCAPNICRYAVEAYRDFG